MHSRFMLILAMFATLFGLATGSQAGEDTKSWIGKTVLPTKPKKDIKIEDLLTGKLVDLPLTSFPIKVREVRAGKLLVFDGHREGWVDRSQFILVTEAFEYFHSRVEANPKDSWAILMRGYEWLDKHEPDIAISDFNDAIRLAPKKSENLTGRGNAWLYK